MGSACRREPQKEPACKHQQLHCNNNQKNQQNRKTSQKQNDSSKPIIYIIRKFNVLLTGSLKNIKLPTPASIMLLIQIQPCLRQLKCEYCSKEVCTVCAVEECECISFRWVKQGRELHVYRTPGDGTGTASASQTTPEVMPCGRGSTMNQEDSQKPINALRETVLILYQKPSGNTFFWFRRTWAWWSNTVSASLI